MSNHQHVVKRPVIAALLLDVSGNLHVGSTPTPNAVDSFHRLRQSSIPFRLCSNASKESTATLVKLLDEMGFGISELLPGKDGSGDGSNKVFPPNLVWTSIGAVAQVLKGMGLKRPFFLLSDSARQEVVNAIRQKSDSQPGEEPRVATYDSVVVGLSPRHFDYPSLNTAFRILKGEISATDPPDVAAGGDPCVSSGNTDRAADHPRIPLIATHKAKFIQTESGLSMGPGPFVTALESASGITAHIVGKPTRAFFETVIQDFTAEELGTASAGDAIKGKIAVVGDDVEADLGEGAVELGLWRILVKTGKYRVGDERKPGIVPPDEVFESFSTFIDSLLSDGDR
ncbi:hypothetical protein HYPSUDRAFT_208695 [Hypholoma sublateritium FD-334 SS-4]|uniref:Uncharacterized protein n=1 Tax=Hypholoma sublateritium (strain FD-334 SS-4) TaxID=945553 RepID=A0A0D2NCY4_HYPSF|nr:hypothetical protein HYPSUDRAFT_208695 [Hypholoma sublateritium FD-334 SS-4]